MHLVLLGDNKAGKKNTARSRVSDDQVGVGSDLVGAPRKADKPDQRGTEQPRGRTYIGAYSGCQRSRHDFWV